MRKIMFLMCNSRNINWIVSTWNTRRGGALDVIGRTYCVGMQEGKRQCAKETNIRETLERPIQPRPCPARLSSQASSSLSESVMGEPSAWIVRLYDRGRCSTLAQGIFYVWEAASYLRVATIETVM